MKGWRLALRCPCPCADARVHRPHRIQRQRRAHRGAGRGGGRGTLIGPIVGAFFVNGAKSWFTVAFPEFWLFFLGALFIAVTLFLPNGVIGLLRKPGCIIGLIERRQGDRS
jgi:hypothetical protein